MSMNDDLKKAIQQGVSLQKVDPEEIKKRDDEKKRRANELKIIAEKLASTSPKGE